MRLDGGEPEIVAEGATEIEDCSGRLLIVYGSTAGCARCQRMALREPDGRERELVRFSASARMYNPRCDRKGQRVLYSLIDAGPLLWAQPPADMWILALDGGVQRRLTSDHAVNFGTFTHEGQSIVYCATHDQSSKLWEIAADGTSSPVQRTFGTGWEYMPDVSSDGRTVVYNIDIGTIELFAQPLSGGPEHRLTSTRQYLTHILATPDGHALLAQAASPSGTTMILRIPLDGTDPVPLLDGATPAISPDGKEVFYSLGSRVMARSLEGGVSRAVTEVPGTVLNLQAGSDEKIHMMTARPEGLEAWSAPRGGGEAARELPAPWSLVSPAPRGGWRLHLAVGQNVEWRARLLAPEAPPDDPDAREVRGQGQLGWAPDGLSFVYHREGIARRFWVETGKEEEIAGALGWGAGVAVSSDGKTLYINRPVGHVRRELITNFDERPPL